MRIAASAEYVVRYANGTYYRQHKLTKHVQVWASNSTTGQMHWRLVFNSFAESITNLFKDQFRPSTAR